ncbi:MAG TPA: ABC transporter permease [Vicinamibacterales bacterium]
MNLLARIVVRFAAWIAPRDERARWREEWLGEIEGQRAEGRGQREGKRGKGTKVLRGVLGAPRDALSLRASSVRRTARSIGAGWGTDIKQTARTLRGAPSHVATVVVCLGVGASICVSVFSAVNALLFGDIPGIADRSSLVRIFIGYEDGNGVEGIARGQISPGPVSISDFEIIDASRGAALSALAIEGDRPMAVSLDKEPVRTTGSFVSGEYFGVLGTAPVMGRLLRPDDDRPDAPAAAVIGYHLWRDRFEAAPDVIGRSILVGDRSFTVVGVTPPRFTGLQPADIGESPLDYTQLWLPMHHAAGLPGTPGREIAWLSLIGRLAPEATQDAALASLTLGAHRLSAAYPDSRRGAHAVVRSHGFGPNDSPIEILVMIMILLSVPVTVLAIGCANVANLQLARATERARELAVRVALGASRSQVVRLLTFEAAGLAILAVTTGWLGARLILIAAQPAFPVPLVLDLRVLAFALLLAGGVILLAGLAPAWIGTGRAGSLGLKQSSRGGGLAHSRLRHALVVVQMALSLALLVTSGLFISSLRAMRSEVPPAARATLVTTINPDILGLTAAETRQVREDLTSRLSLHPRVQSVGIERRTGFRYWAADADINLRMHAGGTYVSPAWFEAANVRIVAGRPLRASDTTAAVVSERMARALAPDGTAVGKVFYVSDSVVAQQTPNTIVLVRPLEGQPPPEPASRLAVEIVGVAADMPRRPGDAQPDPVIYRPLPADASGLFTLRIRTDDAAAMTQIRDVIRQTDRRLGTLNLQSAEELFLREIGPVRAMALSIGGLGVVALLLAAAGLYAVMAYLVSLRRQEIGIRMAIGARPVDVVRLVFRQGLRLSVLGSLAGMAIATPIAMGLGSAFVGVSALDPAAVLPPAGALVMVALLASTIPARRAARIDPIRALRED